MKHLRPVFLFFLLPLAAATGHAQALTGHQIDSLVEKALKTFDVPGMAVAVIKDNKVIHARGYGVRSLNSRQPVDENTLFGIASNSKAFTTAAIAQLVDAGKLNWDDKVTTYIPEFNMYDPYVTSEFTIRDLLTHRSGLGLGAGDLMFFPGGSDFNIKDVIHNLRYLKPVSSFRSKFDYDNTLYIVAGEVIARVSGMSWEAFVETRLMRPLGMQQSAASYRRLKDRSNVIDPHAPVDGKVKVIPRDLNDVLNPAGGIYSNIADMSKWLLLQLNKGAYGKDNGQQLFSKARHQEMWMPQTIIETGGGGPYNNHFVAYGLGWFMGDEKGYKQLSHTGGLSGIVTQVAMVPDLQLGIVVLTNQQTSAAFSAVTNAIKDSYYGVTGLDRIKTAHDRLTASEAETKKITSKIWEEVNAKLQTTVLPDTATYAGTYKDAWLGEVTISLKNGKLWFNAKRSPGLSGEMLLYKANTFVVKWEERSMDADAFVMFTLDESGRAAGFKMKPVSPATDFSYDFQDLDFQRTITRK